MNFADAIRYMPDKTTENGAVAHSTLNDPLLELFAQAGALRERSEEEIAQKFMDAYMARPSLATRMLFYIGNIRGGLGERRTFRICLNALAKHNPQVVKDNFNNIAAFNRFDSFFALVDTPLEGQMWRYLRTTLAYDKICMQEGKSCSLLAKWLPSEKASSAKTRELYMRAIHGMGLTPRTYRKVVSALRKYIDVTECKMSAKDWGAIDYEAVPSKAMLNYRNAFNKHNHDRFAAYLDNVSKGEAKINAGTLYPYDLVGKYTHSYDYYANYGMGVSVDPVIEQQWRALPNYIEGNNNVLVMADVSGSMTGRPMDTSIGLAIYFAERNNGAYEDIYMTFSDDPKFMCIDRGQSLARNVHKVMNTDIGYNTDLEAAFEKILDSAIRCHVEDDEMPKALIVISDMEIDHYIRNYGLDFVEEMKGRFEVRGYTMPRLILWNVEARHDTFLSKDPSVVYVSGQSVSTFKTVLGVVDGDTAWDVMVRTLMDPMYDRVVTQNA